MFHPPYRQTGGVLLKAWKIVSGIISILLCCVISVQSVFAEIATTLMQTGALSGTAGLLVAILLLLGGVVSLATCNGSRGGDVALSILYFLAALLGFLFAGGYTDLILWALWCLICMFASLFSVAFGGENRSAHSDDEPIQGTPLTMTEPLKQAIFEPNPNKRNTMVDDMTEEDAKASLKYILGLLARKKPRDEADKENDPGT